MENLVIEIPEPRPAALRRKSLAYVELTKPRIAILLVLTAAAGFYLGSDAGFSTPLFLNSMTGIALLAFGVSALNQVIERRTDALMTRTLGRPLPTGVLSAVEAGVFGGLLCVIAEIYLFVLVNNLTAVLGLVVITGYVLLYTPLKTRTSASTAIGAVPGALPPLMGFTAAANHITLGSWILFAILFLWQFPHFLAIAWMYRDQYAAAGIKMLPVLDPSGRLTARQIVVFTVLLLPISVGPFFVGMAGFVYLVGTSILGIWFLYSSIAAARSKSTEQAKKLLMVSVLYLPLIFALMVLDHR
jgi:heme o synthase